MSKTARNRNTPIRYGNAFPWVGILAGVRRMMFYCLLLVGLLIVLGAIVAIGLILVDNEPVGDYF